MRKTELFDRVSFATGKPKQQVREIAEELFTQIKKSMIEGHDVYVRGFATFAVIERKQKIARNISTNTPMVVPAHKIPVLKAAPEFKEKVRAGK